VGLQDDFRDYRVLDTVRPLARVPRILVPANVRVRPAEEVAGAHLRHVVGHELVAKAIAFLHRDPRLVRRRMEIYPDRVARTRDHDLAPRPIRPEAEDGSAQGIRIDVDVRG
jgi:hypothetical protein